MKITAIALIIAILATASCRDDQTSAYRQRVYMAADQSSCGPLNSFRWEPEPFKGNVGKEFFGIRVHLLKTGGIYWNGQQVDHDRLKLYAQQISRKDPRVQVLLQIEDGARCNDAFDVARMISDSKACDGRKCLVIPSNEAGPIVQ